MLKSNRMVTVVMWTITLVAAVAIGFAGLSKLVTTGDWDRLFASWGYPTWFMIAIACAEMFGAAALLIRRFAIVGAAVLGVVMLGGVGTLLTHPGSHFFKGRQAPMTIATPLVWVVLLSVVAALRWRQNRLTLKSLEGRG
jgi:uncharacterized membrane protein YphA (DoxX/SURF4 family)